MSDKRLKKSGSDMQSNLEIILEIRKIRMRTRPIYAFDIDEVG